MASQPMKAGLRMRFDRTPDFFALLRAHGHKYQTHLFEQDGHIVAVATLVIRKVYINGQSEQTVYLSDLRVKRDRKLAGQWHRLFLQHMRQLSDEYAARYACMVILKDNKAAQNALIEKSRFGFTHMQDFNTVSILARKPLRKKTNVKIRHAQPHDLEQLSAFLDANNIQQPLGVIFSGNTLQQRLNQWPGLKLKDFLLAENANGLLTGCLAPWDYSGLKQVILDGLPPTLDTLRQFMNVVSPITGRPRIASPPNAELRDIAVSHVAISERNLEVFGALLSRAYDEVFQTGTAVTLSLSMFEGDSLKTV